MNLNLPQFWLSAVKPYLLSFTVGPGWVKFQTEPLSDPNLALDVISIMVGLS